MGTINILGCTVGNSSERPHCFVISRPQGTYYLCAANDEDLEAWKEAIASAIDQRRRLAQSLSPEELHEKSRAEFLSNAARDEEELEASTGNNSSEPSPGNPRVPKAGRSSMFFASSPVITRAPLPVGHKPLPPVPRGPPGSAVNPAVKESALRRPPAPQIVPRAKAVAPTGPKDPTLETSGDVLITKPLPLQPRKGTVMKPQQRLVELAKEVDKESEKRKALEKELQSKRQLLRQEEEAQQKLEQRMQQVADKIQQVKQTATPTSSPSPSKKVIAEFDHEADEDDELEFKEGDVITVLQEDSSGWWLGTLENRRGIFPANYTKPFTG